jgi:hypothetical protein
MIRPGALIALHMVLATEPSLRRPTNQRSRLWRYVALVYLAPSGFALATVAALWVLRRGL